MQRDFNKKVVLNYTKPEGEFIAFPVMKKVGKKTRRASISVLEIGITGYGKSKQVKKNSRKIDEYLTKRYNGELFRKINGKALFSKTNYSHHNLKTSNVEYILQCRQISPRLFNLIDNEDIEEVTATIKNTKLEKRVANLLTSPERCSDIYRFIKGKLYSREGRYIDLARGMLAEKYIIKAINDIIKKHKLEIDFHPGPKLNLSTTGRLKEQEIDVVMVFYNNDFFYNKASPEHSLIGILETGERPHLRLWRNPKKFSKKMRRYKS